MKKTTKFISTVVILTFLWQSTGWAGYDSLRPRSYRERKIAQMRQRSKTELTRRRVIIGTAIGATLIVAGKVLAPFFSESAPTLQLTKPPDFRGNWERYNDWFRALIQGDIASERYIRGPQGLFIDPSVAGKAIAILEKPDGENVLQIIKDRFASGQNETERLFFLEISKHAGNHSTDLLPSAVRIAIDALNDDSSEIRSHELEPAYNSPILNPRNYPLLFAELNKRTGPFDNQIGRNLIVCRAETFSIEGVKKVIFGSTDEYTIQFLPEDEDEFLRVDKAKGDFILGYDQKYRPVAPAIRLYNREHIILDGGGSGEMKVTEALRSKGVIGGRGLVVMVRGDASASDPFLRYLYHGHNHPSGSTEVSVSFFHGSGDMGNATIRTINPFEAARKAGLESAILRGSTSKVFESSILRPLATGESSRPILPATDEVLAVRAMAADGKPITIYLDKKGVVEGIDRLARKCGLRVQFAAGAARRMLFGKNPAEESADVDLVMCAPVFSIGTLLWKFKITDEIQLPARYVRRLARFKKQLADLYPNLDIETINDVDEDRLIAPYRRVSNNRALTVDRMLVYRLKTGEWFVTDEAGGLYLADARERRLCLLPKSGEIKIVNTPQGVVRTPGPFLSYDCVLRFARVKAEFPDAEIDPNSFAQIQSFVNSDTRALREDDPYLYNIEDTLESFRRADPKMLGLRRLPPLQSLFSIFMHAKDVNDVIPLLKSIGTPKRNLYTLYSRVINLEYAAAIARNGGGKTGNLSDFDSAFVDEVRAHRYAIVYSDDAFIDFLMDELKKDIPHEYLERARGAITAFAKIEHASWLARTNVMFIGERMIERYLLPRIWHQVLLSGRLSKGLDWDIDLDTVVSPEFYKHVYTNRARIEKAINSGRYQNLLDYYFKVFKPVSAANRQLDGVIQNARLNDILRPRPYADRGGGQALAAKNRPAFIPLEK